MYGCKNCTSMGGWIFLILGVLFLLKDIGNWGFFGINWWTALFIVMGIGKICMAKCPDCQAMCNGKGKKR